VKKDLSDLEEKIEWCRANDDACRKIAEAAVETYERYVSKEGILDYLEMYCSEISKRQVNLVFYIVLSFLVIAIAFVVVDLMVFVVFIFIFLFVFIYVLSYVMLCYLLSCRHQFLQFNANNFPLHESWWQ
jgi:hypothetical protein